MQIDNPNHRDHYRYHLIVNRVTVAVIGLLLCLLSAEIIGTWMGMLAPLVVVGVFLIAYAATMSILAVVIWFILEAIEFFQGY